MKRNIQKTVFRFATLCTMFLVAAFLMAGNPLMASSGYKSPKKNVKENVTAYAQLQDILRKHQYNTSTMSVLDSLTDLDILFICPDIKKVFDVPYTAYYGSYTIGDILTDILCYKEKNHKENARWLHHKFQYSNDTKNIALYMILYPKSKYYNEMYEKYICMTLVDSWRSAQDTNTIQSYQNFLDFYKLCSFYYSISKNEQYDFTDYGFRRCDYEGFDKIDLFSFVLSAQERINEFEKRNELIRVSWEKAKKENTHTAYYEYYLQYPESDSAATAWERMKIIEQSAWENATKKDDKKAYKEFLNQYPDGYYSSEAAAKIVDLHLETTTDSATIQSLTSDCRYSRSGYSLICLGNVDKHNKKITITLKGATNYHRELRAGEYQWLEVKDGDYTILVEAPETTSWWGNISCHGRIYDDAWYTYTTFFHFPRLSYLFNEDADEDAYERMQNSVQEKCQQEYN